ncbi:MAG: type I DNA topoisomerase [Oscillospiraceae bacterium]|jgi:DNA topoisomerase-1|nr:type I DNA topoisomerase [Oscillospiraceae bacterium]
MKNLVIVESPAKAKTIKKYLGKNYDVVASMGHVRDLPKSRLGIDIANNFEPHYINMRDKSQIIKNLKTEAKGKDKIYLATDPDREGEAIAWHLAHIFNIKLDDPVRVTFNEITKTGVKNGMANPRKIDADLVNAQQARRVLDRLVGYQLSPFLWRKVGKGLSAGRVQSVAVKLISDREKEIRDFKSEEFWTIDAALLAKSSKKAFPAKFYGNPKKLALKNGGEAAAILKDLEGREFTADSVKRGERQKTPAPPFTTSTLQQEASRKLGFQARRAMKAAQELYEGLTLPSLGDVGLITYMRTDSLRVSDEAYTAAAAFISEKYGAAYLPPQRRLYKSRANAQDGHEAIRPTMPELAPDQVKNSLSPDQFKLYRLIWMRFIASQMAAAVLDTVSAEISAGKYKFKASGYSVKFDGFTALYEEGVDALDSEASAGALPYFEAGEKLKLKSIAPNQHFTQPPPRYTEASLIKAMEENGIGRPSTYAPTITTITTRGYVSREGKTLKPTELGEVTTGLMREQFEDVVNVEFTANMEKSLDRVEKGNEQWKNTISAFYTGFAESLEKAEKALEGVSLKIPDEPTGEICPICGKAMVLKTGRFGKFIACSGYPECKNTKSVAAETGGFCPKCGGRILAKKSKKGRAFYGCENYPACDFATWDLPLKDVCPQCGSTLFKKSGKTQSKIHCAKEGCDYTKAVVSQE